LLDDGVFFALLIEEFLGNILHDGVEERERARDVVREFRE
jgi:hypothetical protein